MERAPQPPAAQGNVGGAKLGRVSIPELVAHVKALGMDSLAVTPEHLVKTLELYQKEYDLGRRTLLDLLVAQNDHIAAQSQIVRAENDLLFAHYRILDAMGSMVQNILGSKALSYSENAGLTVLDSDLNKDDKVENLIFADRQEGQYMRDSK